MDFRKNFNWMCFLSLCLAVNAHNINRKEVESLIVESSNKEALRSPQKYIIKPIQTLTKVSDNFVAPPYDAVDFGFEDKLNEVESKNDDSNPDEFKVGNLNTQDKVNDKSTQTEGNLENTVNPITLDNIKNENKLIQNEQKKIGKNSPDSKNTENYLNKVNSATTTANKDKDKFGLKDDLPGKEEKPLNLIKLKTKLDSKNIENPSNYLRTFPELKSEDKAIISKTECNITKNIAKESINFETTIPRKENLNRLEDNEKLNLIKVESSNVNNLENNQKEISASKEIITSTANITKDKRTKSTKGDKEVNTEDTDSKGNANESLNSETITPSQEVSETGTNDSNKVKESITSESLFVNSPKKLPENDKKMEDQINLEKSLNKENEDDKQQVSKDQSENLQETLNSISTRDSAKFKTTSRETSNEDKTEPTKGDKVETTETTKSRDKAQGSLDSEKITLRQIDNKTGEKGSKKVEETLFITSGLLTNESVNDKEIRDQTTLEESLDTVNKDNTQQISQNTEKQSGNLQGTLNIISSTEATKIKTTSQESEIDNKTEQTKDDKTVTTADNNLIDKADGPLDSEKITNTQVDIETGTNVFEKVKETINSESLFLTSAFLTSENNLIDKSDGPLNSEKITNTQVDNETGTNVFEKVEETNNSESLFTSDTEIKDQTNLVESLNIQQISENQSEHLQETLDSISTTEATYIEATSGETSFNIANSENQQSPPKTTETTLLGVNEVLSNETTLTSIILGNQTITQHNTETYPSTTTEKIPKRKTTKEPPRPLVVLPGPVYISNTAIKPVTENPTKATTKQPTTSRRPIFGWWPLRPTFNRNPFNTNNQTSNFGFGIFAVPLNWRPRLPNLLATNRFSETSPQLTDATANAPESRDIAFWNTLFHHGKTLNETGSLKQNYLEFNKTETTNDTSAFWKPWKNISGADFFKFLKLRNQNEQAIIPANTRVLVFNLPVKYPFPNQIVQTPARKLNDKVVTETVAEPVAAVEDTFPVNVSVRDEESGLAGEPPKELSSSSAEAGSNDEKAVMAKGNEKASPIFESELLKPVVHFARRVMNTFMLPENLF